MSLSITEQKIKGGHQVLMVRDGTRRLMAFPPSMRDLATQMCLEGNEVSEEQYPELIAKFAKKRAALLKTKSDKPVVSPVITAAEALGNFEPIRPKPRQSEPPAPWQIPDEGNESQPEKQVLADLLEAARQAEITLAAKRETLHNANVDFSEAKNCAEGAWKAFNEALRASLPEDTNVFGVSLNMLRAGTE